MLSFDHFSHFTRLCSPQKWKHFILIPALLSSLAFAQTKPQQNLQSVQQAIEAAQSDLQQKQQAQHQAKQTLNRTQSEIARIQRELSNLTRKQNHSLQQLNTLRTQLHRLQTEIGHTKAQVARLLSANYKNKQPHAVVLFLNNASANQKSRFLHYSRYINAANDKVLDQLVEQKKQLNQQETLIQTELKRLQNLSENKEKQIAALRKNAQTAQVHQQQLNQQIQNQTQKINRLRQDEQRLNQLIRSISQPNNKKKSPAQTQNQPKPPTTTPSPRTQHSSPLTHEDLNLQASDHFTRLQGKLNRPINGQLTGRFGQNREDSGTWRGLFFKTSPAAVRAIAEGQVAYTGTLTGYGNTVVINHSDGYVSVYTGLNNISVQSNTSLSAGQIIGNSGSLPNGEQGLYFELRYRGTPINPISWFK